MAISETPTGTLDPIPDLIKETLEKLDIRPEQIRFAVQSDVSSIGSYGEEWFVLTDAAIFTVTGEGEVLHYIPYEKVLGIRPEIVVDAGILVLETEDGTVESHPLLKRLCGEIRVCRAIYRRRGRVPKRQTR